MKSVRWWWHWLRQGLKLLLFEAVAGMIAVPFLLPILLLDEHADKLDKLGGFGGVIDVGARLLFCGIGLAVFTAVLATQLKSHPLVGPEPREQTEQKKG